MGESVRKHPGKRSDRVMEYVHADKDKVIEEITSAGSVPVDDKPLLCSNYFLEFREVE